MKVLTNNQYYSQIANVIREQNGTNNTYKPVQMVSALKDLFYEEVEGVPPISFQGIGENLLDYRIDGAVGGVGDRTNNLFDKTKTNRKLSQAKNLDGTMNYTTTASNFFDYYIPVEPNTQYIITNGENAPSRIYFFKNDKAWIDRTDLTVAGAKSLVFTTPSNCYYIQFQESKANMMNENTLMLNVGNISLPYEPYGYKVPVVVSGKNLFDEANSVVTDYYLTNNGQEAVGANGDRFLKSYINVNPSTEYTFKWSQTIMGSANNTPYIRISEYTSNKTFIKRLLCQCSAQSQNKYTFTTSDNTVYIDIRIDDESSTRGQHLTGIMLVKGATAPDTYEEYTATTTNIYLDEPIGANESISLSDTNVNIPTIRGTNVLTVDTTVQPSNVYVKSRKESSYETAMREDYEEQLSDIESALQEV